MLSVCVSESSNMVTKYLEKPTERRKVHFDSWFLKFHFMVIWLLSFRSCGKVKHHGGWTVHWDESLTSAGKRRREGEKKEMERQGENRNYELKLQLRN